MNRNELGDFLYRLLAILLPFAFFAFIAWTIFRAITGDLDSSGGPQWPQEVW